MKTISYRHSDGFGLIELIFAIFVFTIGILGVAAMQIQSIKANSVALDRSEANALGVSVMEMLKNMDFAANELTDSDNDGIAGLDDGKPNNSTSAPDPTVADHQMNTTLLGTGGAFASLGNSYTINGTQLIDSMGNRYTLFWNVADVVDPGTGATNKIIRLLIYWNSNLGRNSLVFTSTKYE